MNCDAPPSAAAGDVKQDSRLYAMLKNSALAVPGERPERPLRLLPPGDGGGDTISGYR
jgi:hypothetical protein